LALVLGWGALKSTVMLSLASTISFSESCTLLSQLSLLELTVSVRPSTGLPSLRQL
jgi:hypothetical protein